MGGYGEVLKWGVVLAGAEHAQHGHIARRRVVSGVRNDFMGDACARRAARSAFISIRCTGGTAVSFGFKPAQPAVSET